MIVVKPVLLNLLSESSWGQSPLTAISLDNGLVFLFPHMCSS